MSTSAASTPPSARSQRDAALRDAHRLAFAKISEACTRSDFHGIVATAVEELVDACEAYAEAR